MADTSTIITRARRREVVARHAARRAELRRTLRGLDLPGVDRMAAARALAHDGRSGT